MTTIGLIGKGRGVSIMMRNWRLNGWPMLQWQAGLFAKREQEFMECASAIIGALPRAGEWMAVEVSND